MYKRFRKSKNEERRRKVGSGKRRSTKKGRNR